MMIVLVYLAFSATNAGNSVYAPVIDYLYKAIIPCPELSETMSVLVDKGCSITDQGVLIETLDGGIQLAALNPTNKFNPASALKIATTLAALEKWGTKYQFTTSFAADGFIDRGKNTLYGNLETISDGDPTFQTGFINKMAAELKAHGIYYVNGDLLIDGPFSVSCDFNCFESAERLRKKLASSGIRVSGKIVWGKHKGQLIVAHQSEKLIDILQFQNARSNNPIAERLGENLGGTDALTLYLVRNVGLELEEVFITHTSGLDYNRISVNGMVKILRKLYAWCKANNVPLDSLMPVAGVDHSTVGGRFLGDSYRGGIIAKTGTLLETDSGVSTLVGFINTQKYGMLVFALFNSHGDVMTYHRWQNNFVEKIIDKSGGVIPFRL
jgi:D-alanyl-D-alanine carboxypeptidase/D-alanyl-D-alanine-endopeptidase (penicillin-binding protein 4)